MNDEDLRDLFAGLALVGMLAGGRKNVEQEAYRVADAMIEAKYDADDLEPEEGITAIKPKSKRGANVSAAKNPT
jgi:hypothetical protein